jgi:hypothetical protein
MRAHAYSAFSLCGDKVTKKIALRSKNRRIIFRCETSGPTGTLPLFRIEFQWSAVHGVRGSFPPGNEKSLHVSVQGSFQDGTSPTWSGIFPVF